MNHAKVSAQGHRTESRPSHVIKKIDEHNNEKTAILHCP